LTAVQRIANIPHRIKTDEEKMEITAEQNQVIQAMNAARYGLYTVVEAFESASTPEARTLQLEAFKLARDAHDTACDEFQTAFIRSKYLH
jgi:hypothetical protein